MKFLKFRHTHILFYFSPYCDFLTLSSRPELLTGLIQMWWHVVAWGAKLRIDSSSPLFPFSPAYLSIITNLLISSSSVSSFMSLCLFPLGGVSHCLLYSSYTNWGQRMCRLSLDCCLPLCICTILLLSPDTHFLLYPHTHTHTPQMQSLHWCSVSLSVNIRHCKSGHWHSYMGLVLKHHRLWLY